MYSGHPRFSRTTVSNSENLDGSVFDICSISRLFITFSNSKQFNSKVRIKVTWKLIPEIECNVKQLTVLLLACRLYQLHSFISVIKSWVENPRIRSRAICSATKGQFTRTKVTLNWVRFPDWRIRHLKWEYFWQFKYYPDSWKVFKVFKISKCDLRWTQFKTIKNQIEHPSKNDLS